MDYRDSFYLFGADAKQIPIIPRHGAPTEDTEGAIGLLCMDVSAPGAPMYKCVEVTEDDRYIWKPFLELTDQIKEMVPATLNTTLVFEEETNSALFPGIPLYYGTKYKVEVWKDNELLGSFTDLVTDGSFGSAVYTYGNEQLVGGLPLVVTHDAGDYIKIGFISVNEECCIRIYSIELDVDPTLDFRLDSRYAKQIDSTAENPVWFRDLSDGIYALRGVFGGGVRLFDNETYSFAILRREFDNVVHLLHTNDFVTFYNTTILSGGNIPIHEPVDNEVAKPRVLLTGDDGLQYTIQIENGQLTVKQA